MPFGKYKGDKLINVPSDYLLWLYDNDKCGFGELFKYIRDNLDVLKQQINYQNKRQNRFKMRVQCNITLNVCAVGD